MMKELKKPLTFSEQVGRLREHGMTIQNHAAAIQELSQINYYRFTGYAYQLKRDKEKYEEGTDFDQIIQIYRFDQILRNMLRESIEIVEVFARTQIAHHFSLLRCANSPCDGHYHRMNFYDKTMYDEVMKNLQRDVGYNKDTAFVEHHRINYNGKMPLWVAVEVMSFANLSKLYHSMWPREQIAIAKGMAVDAGYLKNHLRCISELRNICAHGGRLYNRDIYPPVKLGKRTLTELPKLKNTEFFAYLIALLRLLPGLEQKKSLIEEIKELTKKHKNAIDLGKLGFPENNVNYLYKDIGLDQYMN